MKHKITLKLKRKNLVATDVNRKFPSNISSGSFDLARQQKILFNFDRM